MNDGTTRSIYIPGDLNQSVNELAERERRSFSNMVVTLLKKAIESGYAYTPPQDCPADTDEH